jgi:hypothetical protein
MMFVDRPWPVTTEAALERRARTSTRPWGVLAAAHRTDLVLGEQRAPAEHRLHGRVDGAEQRVHGAVPGRVGGPGLAVDVTETLPCERPPWLDVTFQPSSCTARGVAAPSRDSATCCSTSAMRSSSVTSFFASASAIASR